jgi:phosphate starvation-inducible PhoH-like protein
LIEKVFVIDSVDPIQFFGVDNSNFKTLKSHFKSLRISSRGNQIKVKGSNQDVEAFEKEFEKIINYLATQPKNRLEQMEEIMEKKGGGKHANREEILVYGPNGKIIKARTPNQFELLDAVESNDIVFAVGPAGTGKTYTSVALAVKAFKSREIKKIILARPAVEAGESLGFLPGDLKEKIDPYLMPLYSALADMFPSEKYARLFESNTIEIIPLAFMRGRTLDNCYVILDEAQNATDTQLKMFLTRLGPSAKMIITGDLTQVDLPKNQKSGLSRAISLLEHIKGIKVVRLTEQDVIRHRLVKKVIAAYDKKSDND